MPKILVISMEDAYPFLLKSHNNQYPPNTPILIRQTFKHQHIQLNQLKAKISFAKNLRNKHLVKIQSIMEETQSIHILYQFIQSKVTLPNPSMAKFIIPQIKQFTKYLSNIGVRISLECARIGLDEKNIVKYFMGVDFIWEESEDQSILPQYYQSELQKVFGHQISQPPLYELVPFQNVQNQKSRPLPLIKSSQDRKSSFATLPSRFNRLYQIDKKLKSMFGDNIGQKSEQDYTPASPINLLRNYKSQQSFKPLPLKPPPIKQNQIIKNKANKKFLDRKFSGDTKLTIVSNKRLYEKQSDIRSERGMEITTQTRISRRRNEQNCREQVQTIQSKSRIDEMKYQQYLQITKSDKGYLKDFLSVLEDQERSHSPAQMHSHRDKKMLTLPPSINNLGKSIQLNRKNNEIVPWVNTDDLQKKARDAISNSMRAIKKFKSFGKE